MRMRREPGHADRSLDPAHEPRDGASGVILEGKDDDDAVAEDIGRRAQRAA